MITRELASGQLIQLLDVSVQGHQSYGFVTRPEHAQQPHLLLFKQWLQQEIWLSEQALNRG